MNNSPNGSNAQPVTLFSQVSAAPQPVFAQPEQVQPAPQPAPQFTPYAQPYAPAPGLEVVETESRFKSFWTPAATAFLTVLVVGMIAFQQLQIGRLEEKLTYLKTDVDSVKVQISATNRKADTALAAIKKAEALQEKVCTIPLIGGLICNWLGLETLQK